MPSARNGGPGVLERLWRPAAARFDARRTIDGRAVRLTNRIDEESERFEEELLARAEPPELPLPQRHAWLRASRRELLLFQAADRAGCPAMQAVVAVYRPRWLPRVARGIAHKLGEPASGDEELAGLRALRLLCRERGDLLTLRLQPRRNGSRALWDFEDRARQAGFALCDPDGVTRTLLLDLRPEPDEILSGMSRKTRSKVRRGGHAGVTIRQLTDAKWIGACRDATRDALVRSGTDGEARVDWEACFAVAQARPDLACVLGLFLDARPGELLAFVMGQRHGATVEYASAGSRSDPALRKLPFNYFLLWELALWGRARGATTLDFGGITEGGAADPLAGVSEFKRHIAQLEGEVGREMEAALHPVRAAAFGALQRARDRVRGA
jgi:hypothetical protein